MRLAQLSIRARVILLVLVVVLPFTAFQALVGVTAYREAIRGAEDDVLAAAGAVAASLRVLLEIAEGSTTHLAETRGRQFLRDPGCARELQGLRDATRFFSDLIVVDREGMVVCTAAADRRGPGGPWSRSWFRRVRDSKRFAVGRPARDPVSHEWVVVVGAPILDEGGAFLGAVAGTMSLMDLRAFLPGWSPAPNELVTITTADGVVIARSADPEEWVGRALPTRTVDVTRRGSAEFITHTRDASGLERLWGRVDLPGVGWRVYDGLPEARVVGPLRRRLTKDLGMMFLALLASLAAAAFLLRGVSRSLNFMLDSVRAVRAGRSTPLPADTPREIREVVTHLNRAWDELRQAEEKERVARTRIQNILDNAVFGIYVSTADGRFLQVNQTLVNMLGYDSAEELMAAGPVALYPDPEVRKHLIETWQDSSRIENLEVQWRTKDGRTLTVRLDGRSFLTGDGQRVYEVIVADVTDQKVLEDIARHQQKMEAVGRLAGGIAHEFNNLLTVLGVNVEFIREALGSSGEVPTEIQEISEALDRARRLTRKLLAFSRKDVTHPREIDLNEVVTGLKGMVTRVLGETVRLETDLAAAPGRILMDPGHIEQIILNLVINARDAFGTAHGRVTIRTGTRAAFFRAGEEAVSAPPRWYTVLTVEDNGPGMEPALQKLVFEPFFTTKPPGSGTGLGLSTVYGIVQDAGGHLRLHSTPGVGTTFEIWLPVAGVDEDDEHVAEPEGEENPVSDGGREAATLLVASSNEALRTLLGTTLEAAGFAVISAEGAREALDAFWRFPEGMDLLIADTDLPAVSGLPLAARLRAEDPDIAVLYVSDRPLPGNLRSGPAAGELLLTPFSRARLLEAVREILSRAEQAS
ncbi:MAG: ATP-binding protein [Gemmatimonadota bacterium]